MDINTLPPVVMQCIDGVQRDYAIPKQVILAIMRTEGAKSGSVTFNKNYTTDVGIMQINTVWQRYFLSTHRVSPHTLKNDDCVNIRAAGYILATELRATGSIWRAIGNYHSRTPAHHNNYISKVAANLPAAMKASYGS